MIDVRARRRHPVAQPSLERLGVGDGRLPIPKAGADFGTVSLPGPISYRIAEIEVAFDAELLGHVLHRGGIDVRRPIGKPAMKSMEQQQHGESEPVGPAFLPSEDVIGRSQQPGLRAATVIDAHVLDLQSRRLCENQDFRTKLNGLRTRAFSCAKHMCIMGP